MNLESTKITSQKTDIELLEFLSYLNNFEKLMTENTDKFEVQGDTFLLALKGMPEIR